MGLDINAALAQLKYEALTSIMDGMTINYPEMKSTLYSIAKTGVSFSSLLNNFSPTFTRYSSKDINGVIILSYLDFYTLYVLLFANIDPVKNLQNIVKSKTASLIATHKDMESVVKEKSLQKTNKYVRYINFLNPRNIDLSVSKSYLLKDRLSDALSVVSALTLPVERTKEVKMVSARLTDSDSYINNIESEILTDRIKYSVNRYGFNKIGISQAVTPLNNRNTYAGNPIITGTIHGFFSDSISVKVTDTTTDINLNTLTVFISASSDNIKWSTPTEISIGVDGVFLIDDDFEVGLSIRFNTSNKIDVGDSWKIEIDYIDIENPCLTAAIRFATLEKLSFVTWDDLTENTLETISSRVKLRRNEFFENGNYDTFTNRINNITPVFSSVNEYEVTFKQNDYKLKSVNGNLVHAFDFDISNIKGIYNEYKSYGITSFNNIVIPQDKPILNLVIDSNEQLNGNRQFIEHSVSITSGRVSLFLPMLNKLDNGEIKEYVVAEVDDGGIGFYTTRFPVNLDHTHELFITTADEETVVETFSASATPINPEQNPNSNLKLKIEIPGFDPKATYVIKYTPLVNSFIDATDYKTNTSKWMFNNSREAEDNIYWMYYKDIDNSVKLAVCTRSSIYDILDGSYYLSPFFGTVAGIIEMRSLDQGYLSPVIFEYSLLGN